MKKHLTAQQKYEISFRLQNKERPIDIAKALGVHRSTISRELKRNKAPDGKYHAEKAQRLSNRRMRARRHYTVLTDEMKMYIDNKLSKEQWSPEQISGRRRMLGLSPISHETIYRYIWEEKHKCRKPLYKYLRHRGRRYNKRGSSYKSRGLPNRVGIENRPSIVDDEK
jgi:IS30 family transposase